MGVNGIYGLSGSGLDVESMVKVGMMSKQNEYDKMQQTYTLNEWKKESYLDVYNKLQTYNTSTISQYTKQQNMNARNATSNNSAITATANASASLMTHTITVNQTATNAYLVGTGKLPESGKLVDIEGIDANSTISFTLYDGGTDTRTISSTSFEGANSTTAKLDADMIQSALLGTLSSGSLTATAINKVALDSDGNVRFSIGADEKIQTGSNRYVIEETTTSITKGFSTTAIGFKVNDNDVNVTYGELAKLLNEPTYEFDFSDFISLLNQKMDSVGVTATYSSADNGALTFTNNQSDGTVSVTLSNDEIGGKILSKMYAAGDADYKNNFATETTNGSTSATSWTMSDTAPTSLGTGVKITLPSDTTTLSSLTFNDLKNEIAKKSNNIRAVYDADNDTFSIYNKNTGANNIVGIKVENEATAALFNEMGLKQSFGTSTSANSLSFSNGSSSVVAGKDASIIIDGEEVNSASNKITDKGVIYDITNVTEKTTAKVGVTQDVEKIVGNVKSFVESYNTLLSDLYKMYNESPNSSYKPLTDAQKAEMTEEQIEKWEKKAKAGMLYHDSTIRKIIDNMRDSISEKVTKVSSDYDNSYSIGISTTGIYGQLTLNEDKLREALAKDPDSVSNVFTTFDSSADAKADRKNAVFIENDGIAQRLGDIMNSSIKQINNVAGTSTDNSDDSTLSTLLRNLQSRMSSFRSMMDAFETKLYKKYDAMESSLAMLGSQLNYVTSAFA